MDVSGGCGGQPGDEEAQEGRSGEMHSWDARGVAESGLVRGARVDERRRGSKEGRFRTTESMGTVA